MDTDLLLVLGSLFFCLALPMAISAYSEERFPRLAALLAVIGGGMVVLALTLNPGGYSFADLPDAVIRVLGRIF